MQRKGDLSYERTLLKDNGVLLPSSQRAGGFPHKAKIESVLGVFGATECVKIGLFRDGPIGLRDPEGNDLRHRQHVRLRCAKEGF